MRSGTRTELKRRWGPQGHRPVASVKIGYEFLYLYAALNPYTGHLIALLLPNMTKDCFEIFMDHFCAETEAIYDQKKVLMILDGASNHQSNAVSSQNVKIKKLPRACPELNPAERFFEQLRTELSNLVFDTLDNVENYLVKILRKYFDTPSLIQSLTLFKYIRRC